MVSLKKGKSNDTCNVDGHIHDGLKRHIEGALYMSLTVVQFILYCTTPTA